MKDLRELDKHRFLQGERQVHDGPNPDPSRCGMFRIPIRAHMFRVMVSAFEGWDHVSVSLPNRCPTWEEMSRIKRMFFKDDEVAMELHVAVAEHKNHHPYCLHLWRPHNIEIPLPPSIMVAP